MLALRLHLRNTVHGPLPTKMLVVGCRCSIRLLGVEGRCIQGHRRCFLRMRSRMAGMIRSLGKAGIEYRTESHRHRFLRRKLDGYCYRRPLVFDVLSCRRGRGLVFHRDRLGEIRGDHCLLSWNGRLRCCVRRWSRLRVDFLRCCPEALGSCRQDLRLKNLRGCRHQSVRTDVLLHDCRDYHDYHVHRGYGLKTRMH